jgi:Spy/CpxP family protein refolding chaperone
MKRVSTALALIALFAGGVAAAQTPPPSSQQPSPSSMAPTTEDPGTTTTAPSSSSQAAPDSGATTDQKAQMKGCITQQRANDPQLSERDAKKVCKAAVKGSPQS